MTEIATIDWFGRRATSVFSENIAIFYFLIGWNAEIFKISTKDRV